MLNFGLKKSVEDEYIDGKCYLLAQSLYERLPSSQIFVIKATLYKLPVHYVLGYHDHFIDVFGIYSNQQELITHWSTMYINDHNFYCVVLLASGEAIDADEEGYVDESLVDNLVTMIRKHVN